MNDKKNIDRLFQERFKDFEATPKDAVWKNIEAQLGKKEKKRVIPIWWRYAGAAAVLLILLTLGNQFINDEPYSIEVPTVVDTNNSTDASNPGKIKISSKNNETLTSEDSLNQKSSEITNPIQQNSKASIASTEKAVSKNNNLKPNVASLNNAISQNNSEDNVNTIVTNNSNTSNIENSESQITKSTQNLNNTVENAIANTQSPKDEKTTLTIEEAIENSKTVAENNSKLNRWSIAPNVAPVYFNSLGEGSSLDQQFVKNSKTGEVNMSYGINASYAINKKVRIRSGINRVNLGYNTNDVVVYESTAFSSSSGIMKNVNPTGVKNNESTLTVISSNNISEASKAPETFKSFNTSLNQSFGFIEVPLEIEYAITDKKLGINVIGGFSSLFLNNNEVYSQPINGSRTYIGEAVNINNVSYSANLGLGLNYKVTKKLDLNLEPMFKYQINTFENTSGDFKPYFIGVYSGFSIKF
ncbi:hypothetical protein [Aestuariibaculum suncheonense]|uniref:Outer membrane protein beta-barrel domain-containing protein n=1 Tax=Aestuariibaculum suncheonense TaxID=1028745 RepID=A0A8J6U9W9_9FLAO|nr:hypothetical protein [Aestuariibaculum suncheonense]MBD0833852.1 hypothetical protein [Aestuariibaculum suncheonense]